MLRALVFVAALHSPSSLGARPQLERQTGYHPGNVSAPRVSNRDPPICPFFQKRNSFKFRKWGRTRWSISWRSG